MILRKRSDKCKEENGHELKQIVSATGCLGYDGADFVASRVAFVP
jgi:hypothetical protein